MPCTVTFLASSRWPALKPFGAGTLLTAVFHVLSSESSKDCLRQEKLYTVSFMIIVVRIGSSLNGKCTDYSLNIEQLAEFTYKQAENEGLWVKEISCKRCGYNC